MKQVDINKTHFLVISKSGGTVETISIFKYLHNLVKIDKNNCVVITEFDSKLATYAEKNSIKILEIPKNVDPVIRFKSKIEGNSVLKDLVQGEVKIESSTIEDFVILRKDGTPTYNLSASVDDHQMNMTHIIRGDDHKINTFKQMQIYLAMKWNLPTFAHIPLIHTTEGKNFQKEIRLLL